MESKAEPIEKGADAIKSVLSNLEKNILASQKPATPPEGGEEGSEGDGQAKGKEPFQKPVNPKTAAATKTKADVAADKAKLDLKAKQDAEGAGDEGGEIPDWVKAAMGDDSEKGEVGEEDKLKNKKAVKEAAAENVSHETEYPEDVREKLSSYDKLRADYDAVIANPIYKLAAQAEKDGKNFMDVAVEIAASNPKYYDNTTLLKMALKEIGRSDAAIERDMQQLVDGNGEFSLEADRMVAEQKRLLNTRYEDKLKALPEFSFNGGDSEKIKTEQANLKAEKQRQLGQNVAKLLDENKGKVFGDTLINLDDKTISEVKKFIAGGGQLVKSDDKGIPDAAELISFALIKLKPVLFKTNVLKEAMKLGLGKRLRELDGSTQRFDQGDGNLHRQKSLNQEEKTQVYVKEVAARKGLKLIDHGN